MPLINIFRAITKIFLLIFTTSLLTACSNSDEDKTYQEGIVLNDPISAVEFNYFSGDYNSIESLTHTQPDIMGITPELNLDVMKQQSKGAYYFRGYFYVEQKEQYRFETRQSGLSLLLINNEVIENEVNLDIGYHEFIYWLIPEDINIQPQVFMLSETTSTIDLAEHNLFLAQNNLSQAAAIDFDPQNIINGLSYHYYELDGISFELLENLSPIEQGNLNQLSLVEKNKHNDMAMIFKGYFNVESAGLYSFKANSNVPLRIYIGEKELINQNQIGSSLYINSIWIEPGIYQLRVEVLGKSESDAINLVWKKQEPNIESQYLAIDELGLTSEEFTKIELIAEPENEQWELGINGRYYFSNQPASINEIDLFMPNTAMRLNKFEIEQEQINYPYSAYFTSQVQILEEGNYTFYLEHDNLLELKIAEQTISNKVSQKTNITNNLNSSHSITYYLGQGYYKLEVFYHLTDESNLPKIEIAPTGNTRSSLSSFKFSSSTQEVATDFDGDLVSDEEDDFPDDPSESSDIDGDGIGDNTDDDIDGDSVLNDDDAFPNDPNEWSDLDSDGIGDNSDTDRDGDGVLNEEDAFPNDPNEWSDLDSDGIGDNSDADRDGDGVLNENDAFPNDATEWADLDNDGIGDNSDTDRDGDGVLNQDDAFPNDATEWSDLDSDGIGDNSDIDRDGDGVTNENDLFPNDASEWADIDNDGIGDNSDPDKDGDGVLNEEDPFPSDPSEWSDLDGDGIGDNTDPDRDGDGVLNEDDALPNDNTEWSDLDGDGVGDNSDPDRDGDGVLNENDLYPNDPTDWADMDGDGIGDNADPDRDGDGVINELDDFPDDPLRWNNDPDAIDTDNDGYPDDVDAFPNDPTEWIDTDGDGIGNNSDPDLDNDGFANEDDAFPNNPNEWRDTDGDGLGDNSDPDLDGDGVDNETDLFPNDGTEWADLDGDGIGDNSDPDKDGDGVNNDEDAFENNPSEWADLDGDGIGNNSDPDKDGDGVLNVNDLFPENKNEWADLDGDGIGNNSDPDKDGDGHGNEQDAFPNDASEWSDIDNDGIGDNADVDRDGDGVVNEQDLFPNDGSEWSDLDRDGIGDNSDPDKDGDGVINEEDAFPDNPNEWADLDKDGIGDNSDPDKDGDGYDNDKDAFPDDPTRWHVQLEIDLKLTGEEGVIHLNWQHEQNTFLHGFNVWRAEKNMALVNIAALDKSITQYLDTDVTNNQQYQYQIEARAENSLLGKSNTPQIYTAFNSIKVENLNIEMAETGVLLRWDAISELNVIIEKRQGIETWVPIHMSDSVNSFLDTNVENGQTYQYRAKTRQNFVDPASGNEFYIDGPLSNTLTQQVQFALNVEFSNVNNVQENTYIWYTRTSKNEQIVSIKGNILNALGSTELTITSADLKQEYTISNNEFTLFVPVDSDHLMWQLTAQSQSQQTLKNPVYLEFKQDNEAPELTIDQSDMSTELNKVTITGVIKDEIGIEQFYMSSDRYPKSQFAFITDNSGQFSGEIPLVFDDNLITVTAIDKLGNQINKQLLIQRLSPNKPVIEITSHVNNQVVNTKNVYITAVINTNKPIESLAAYLNNSSQGDITWMSDNQYSVSFNQLELELGDNLIEVNVSSKFGNDHKAIKLNYQELSNTSKPEIQISSPVNNSQIKQSEFEIKGYILSEDEVDLTVTNQAYTDVTLNVYPDVTGRYIFSYSAKHSEGPWTLTVTNNAGSSELTLNYTLDQTPPVIQLQTPLVESPSINQILQVPFTIFGVVIDDEAVTFTINDEVVNLLPTGISNQYSFDLDINLPHNEERLLELKATDFAGNSTVKSYIVNNQASTSIDIIAPAKNKQFLIEENTFDLQIVAQLNNASVDSELYIKIDDQPEQKITAINTLINTSIPLSSETLSKGPEHIARIKAYDINGQLQGESQVNFEINKLADVPLTVVQTQPKSLESQIETNAFIAFYFNKTVDKSLINIEVTETVHGQSYIDETEPGTNLLEPKGAKLQEVNKNNELVSGSLASLPGDHSYAFYPDNGFAYGATIKVKISVSDKEMSRFSFNVKPLPTLLDGNVKDSFGASVSDIKVRLNELNRQDITDSDGTFSFGYIDTGHENIQSGDYTLEINPNRENPNFGNYIRYINIAQGKRNRLGVYSLPVINKTVPFSQVKSGQGNTTLANGDLKIDFSSANINTSQGQNTANVQFSLLETSTIGMQMSANTPALWVFAGQPQGIQITGDTPLTITAASFYGSYQYLPDDGDYLVLIGRKSNTDMLDAVGVGIREGVNVRSIGPVHLSNLDYIGFARVHSEKQLVLQDYVQGKIGLVQLKAMLQTSVNP
ncbi:MULTISPECIES: thrombospondin type 3 repeat-containing protein [unclassified Pseudoalteromonas]|uniref:thrombospondin type 3 repeat-containing protein n=1 Tax=unclassified Pseudoalteromonas TaxID=194690 RepID=UPI000694730B|nr:MULTISPECIES: thrombospondin type 3 repeat-containing protein [unclassified Pseudoalteromonas]